MMRLLLTMMVIAAVFVPTTFAKGPAHGPAPSDDGRFVFLKKLQGNWVVESAGPEGHSHDDKDGPKPGWAFSTTAAGNAVVERMMIGTPMEMMTVYHMNGTKLVATHYCMMGNQPHLTAAHKIKDGALTMTCNGKLSNADSHDSEHMHRITMRLAKDGKLHIQPESYKEGKITPHPAFVLARKGAKGHRH